MDPSGEGPICEERDLSNVSPLSQLDMMMAGNRLNGHSASDMAEEA